MLHWVGLWWGAQLVGAALLAVWGLAGFSILASRAHAFPDRFALAVTSVALGLVLHLGLAFVLFHRGLVKALGLADMRAAALIVLLALLGFAVRGARRLRRGLEPCEWFGSPVGALVLFAGATVVALLSAYGSRDGLAGPENQVSAIVAAGQPLLGREVVPEWGSTQDRHRQLFEGRIATRGFPKGFPRGIFEHRGVETTLTAVAYLVGPLQEESWMAVAKPLCLLWLFLAAFGLYQIARERAPEGAAVAAGLGALFFAALNPAVLTLGEASSYRIFPASGSMYHNVTQQAALAVGFVGLALCTRALRGGAELYAPGCALLVASLFCKPTFFLVAGPMALAASVVFRGALERRDRLAGAGWLVGGALAWVVYPLVFDLPARAMPVQPGLFAFQRNTDLRLPWDVSAAHVAIVSVVLLSFAAFLVPAADVLRRRVRPSAATWLLLAIAVAGLAWGILLVERGQREGQGNVTWTASAALLLTLPLLAQAIARLRSRGLRAAAWTVYAAHLVSGAWNLWLFGYRGLF